MAAALVARAPRIGLAVAVGTQQPQVLQAVVQTVPVDVMQFQRQRPATPIGQAAGLAPPPLEPRHQQPRLDVLARPSSSRRQNQIQRLQPRPHLDRPAADGVRPGVDPETELPPTLGRGVTHLVERPDAVPVVAPARLRSDRDAQPASVKADRRSRQAERPRNLRLGQTVREEPGDSGPGVTSRPTWAGLAQDDLAALHRPIPRAVGDAELPLALSRRMPGLIEAGDLRPVIPFSHSHEHMFA